MLNFLEINFLSKKLFFLGESYIIIFILASHFISIFKKSWHQIALI
jgi:hypothetical protein